MMSMKQKGLNASLLTYSPGKSELISLQRGDAVVICDAGGGTVDLISYEVESMNPFQLRALTIPSGKSDVYASL